MAFCLLSVLTFSGSNFKQNEEKVTFAEDLLQAIQKYLSPLALKCNENLLYTNFNFA